MRHVAKQTQAEPSWFAQWRQRNVPVPARPAAWAHFQKTKTRKRLHVHLLAEQGFVCCYCGVRLAAPPAHTARTQTDETSHIEHVEPKSGPSGNPARALDYDNLLVSCGGLSKSGPRSHCGHAKRDWYDPQRFVSPLDLVCATAFVCEAEGTILPADGDPGGAAGETVRRLGLNCDSLRDRRAQAIAQFVTGFPEPDSVAMAEFAAACDEGLLRATYGLTQQDVASLVDACQHPDGHGRHTSFGSEIASVLLRYP